MIVAEVERPVITGISFNFESDARANKFICQCSEPITISVQVFDSDTACADLAVTWSATGPLPATTDATASIFTNPRLLPSPPGGPCTFAIDVDTTVALGDYNVTFTASDGTTEPGTITFPLHVIQCDNLCECALPSVVCDNLCTDLTSDENNCGQCGTECPVGSTCTDGVCSGECPGGTVDCDPGAGLDCININDGDNNNCGACGNVCPGGSSCVDGVCTPGCPPGTTDCDPGAGLSCININNGDNNNCGACGLVCNTQCINGTCPPTLTCLEEAATFAILPLDGGSLIINSATTLVGDVGYSDGVTSTTNQKIDSWTGGAYVSSTVGAFSFTPATYNPSDGIHYGTSEPAVDTRLDDANTAANSALTQFNALFAGPADYELGALGDNDSQVINAVGTYTTVDISSIDFKEDSITLVGTSSDYFIIRVTGDLSWDCSEVILSGGVTASNVLWIFPNASNIDISKDCTVWNGTILAPTGNVIYHNPATFNGAIIAKNINVHSDFNLTHVPSTIPCPP